MLEATLTADVESDGVALTLTVENTGDESVELTFSDGQRVEFVAQEGTTREVWRWSNGRMFPQALGTEEFAPGEERTYDGRWPDPPDGEYLLRGWLVANNGNPGNETTVTI